MESTGEYWKPIYYLAELARGQLWKKLPRLIADLSKKLNVLMDRGMRPTEAYPTKIFSKRVLTSFR